MARQNDLSVGQLLTQLRERRTRLLDLVAQIDAELGDGGSAVDNGVQAPKVDGRRKRVGGGGRKSVSSFKEALLSALRSVPNGLTRDELRQAVPGADLRALRFEQNVKKRGDRYVMA